jgi:hypothetical protein
MYSSLRFTLSAIALLSSISVAAAADNGMSATKTMAKDKMASSNGLPQASDILSLTAKQRKAAWKDINTVAVKENKPAGFTATVGAAVPRSLSTYPVPVTAATKVPKLRPYQYAMLTNDKLLIINPNDKKVADVISR